MAKAPINMSVRITDKGIKSTTQAVFGKRDSAVKVGIFGDKGAQLAKGAENADGSTSKGSITMAQLGEIHEFGLGNVPERSFIRSYFDSATPQLRALLFRMMQNAIQKSIRTGKPISDGERKAILSKLGLKMQGDIQKRISNEEITPKLSESEAGRKTIARKGSSVTLIDSGQLRSSISYEVELDPKPMGGSGNG